MRLATITNWAYGVTLALALASGATMLAAASAQERERAAAEQRHDLDRATSTLDQDVEVLSSLARQYAVSGDQADLVAYRHEAGLLRSVEERTRHIRDAGAGQDELRSLHETLRWADALQDEQRSAIAARGRGDTPGAIAILFSSEYERELDRIQASVERFQERVDQRTEQALRAAAGATRLWRTVSQAVLAATGLIFLCVLYFLFRQRILRPVVRLSDVVTRLAAQDFAAEPPDYTRIDEIGDMAQALRIFRENGLARQRLEQERDLDRSRRDLLSRMTQRMQSCASVADLEAVIHSFVPEIAPDYAGRLYLLDEGRNAMVEACSWLEPVHSRPEFPPLACWGLRRGSAHRPGGGAIDVPCDHIHPVAGVIPDSLCLPLATRHGSLGLLFFERKPEANGAELPQAYLETLGENVALALDNLRLRDALRRQATRDPLTGLANRRQLDTSLESELARADTRGTPISCVMLDVDHFKRFNDEYGHDAGDAVLRAVGELLEASLRERNLAFRYGGEEFLLLMPGLEAAQAAARAEEILDAIRALRLHHEGRALGPITASVGVASAPEHCPPARLVQTADACLLRAKRAGRDRVVVAQSRGASRAAGA